MKKIKLFLLLAVFSILSSSALFADMVIDTSSLPKEANTFIKTYFPSTSIMYAERDYDKFEVYLSDGTEIEFIPTGEWKEIKSYNSIPTGFIPANVLSVYKQAFPNASIIQIEKKFNVFEIKLNNMMELYIDINGQLLGQKFDD